MQECFSMWQYFGTALMSDILRFISFYYVIYVLRRICSKKTNPDTVPRNRAKFWRKSMKYFEWIINRYWIQLLHAGKIIGFQTIRCEELCWPPRPTFFLNCIILHIRLIQKLLNILPLLYMYLFFFAHAYFKSHS